MMVYYYITKLHLPAAANIVLMVVMAVCINSGFDAICIIIAMNCGICCMCGEVSTTFPINWLIVDWSEKEEP